MPRPVTRTARLHEADQKALRYHFGTISNAWDRLQALLTGVTWHTFRLAAAGAPARPNVVETIHGAIARWKQTNLKNPGAL